MDKNWKKYFYRNYVIVALVLCFCFLATSLIFLYYMTQQNDKESMDYLRNDAQQKKMTITKQIQGDIQTLEGIAVSIRGLNIENAKEMANIMQEINNGNAFIRMGLADLKGNVELFNIGGERNKTINVYNQDFFQKALKAESSVSHTLEDPFAKGSYINYYAVPVKNKNNETVKILCAVNTSKILSNIIDSPIFKGAGFSNIIDSKENFVIRAVGSAADQANARTLEEVGIFTKSEIAMIKKALKAGEGISFSYDMDGKEQFSVIEPIGINGWFITGSISKSVIKKRYNQTAIGVAAIIFAALCIFLMLLYQQQRIMNKNQKSLMELAYTDRLTGCNNFSRFLLDAPNFIQKKRKFAIWYGDLKKFKYFNDAFGYKAGDRILKELAKIFHRFEGEDFLFCRVSADNFAGIFSYNDKGDLIKWFETLEHLIKNQGISMGDNAFINLCMGFYCPESQESDDVSINDMVNRANMAQKACKMLPGNQYCFFTDEIRLHALNETAIETEGKTGVKKGQFVPYFQPKINIQHGNRLVGAEVLARWNHPEKGLISPGEFIPVFEKAGLIVELDRYMFEEACKWLRNSLDKGYPQVNLAINVSRLGLLQQDFLEFYSKVKEKYQIPDNLLELEFTESLVFGDDEMFYNLVRALQSRGFVCSLDDFGSGYSSLNILKNLPVNILKLDILFFQESVDTKRERIVVSNIINMAKDLNINTIAEGVESLDSVEFLTRAGCDIVQGFVFEKPMSSEDFRRLLQDMAGKAFTPHDCVAD